MDNLINLIADNIWLILLAVIFFSGFGRKKKRQQQQQQAEMAQTEAETEMDWLEDDEEPEAEVSPWAAPPEDKPFRKAAPVVIGGEDKKDVDIDDLPLPQSLKNLLHSIDTDEEKPFRKRTPEPAAPVTTVPPVPAPMFTGRDEGKVIPRHIVQPSITDANANRPVMQSRLAVQPVAAPTAIPTAAPVAAPTVTAGREAIFDGGLLDARKMAEAVILAEILSPPKAARRR